MPGTRGRTLCLGAFIFEDVGVTAYHGAAPLITSPGYLLAAAGILAVEAYHAGILRTTLFAMSQQANSAATYGIDIVAAVTAITNLRNALSGGSSDASGMAFARNTREVLNIVYGAVGAGKGLFFPDGMSGLITS